MSGRRRVTGGDEQDVHTGWRRVLVWNHGDVAKIKRRTRRRERREGKQQIRMSDDD